MIDFRYHLVSLIAIFLALAVGIVVGTTALNGVIVTNLHHSVAALQTQQSQLQSRNDALAAQLAAGQRFAAAVEPELITGVLAGQRLAVVALPGTTVAELTAAVSLVDQAGASITEEIALGSALTAAASQPLVGVTSRDSAPAGLTLTGLTPGELAAEVIAAGVAAPGQGGAAALSGMAANGLLSLVGTPSLRHPNALLLVAGAPPAASPVGSPAAEEQNLAAAFTTALTQAAVGHISAVEVAGPQAAAGAGGLVAAVRADAGAASVAATVDGLDTPIGQVAAVFALAAALRGEVGGYGTAPGDVPLPPLAAVIATPGAPATPSPSARTSRAARAASGHTP